LRAILQSSRQHQICKVAAGHQQHTSCRGEQQLQPILILIPHGGHAGAPGDQMQSLLLPELLLAWLHIGYVAGQPVVEFHLQFGFERLRIDARAHSADQVQEVTVRPLQPRRLAIDQQLRGQRQPKVRHAPSGKLRPEESRRRHAHHGKRMPVDLIACADDRRVGAILLLPDAVAHHRRRRRTLLIVRIGQ